MSLTSTLPFGQQLELIVIQSLIGLTVTGALFYLMFKTDVLYDMVQKLQRIMGKTYMENDYRCTCERCKYQLTTKKGIKQWKKDHKFRKEDGV